MAATGTILDKIVASTHRRVEREKQQLGAAELARQAENGPREGGTPHAFYKSLAAPGMGFICEVKKASPSKGLIAPHFPYLQIAREYEQAGAAAVSVLTEPEFFKGDNEYLREIAAAVAIPALRKDFIVDEYQVVQAAALGAAAVLLICAILDDAQLEAYRTLAEGYGMDALVETHDEGEVRRAVASGAKIIGVNNRDLRTFAVDTGTSVRLRPLVPPGTLFVSESGIATRADVALLEQAGVNAVLVGETLMRTPDKKAALATLRGDA